MSALRYSCGGRKYRTVHGNADRRSHYVEQNPGATSVIQMFEAADEIGKWPRQDANFLPLDEVGIQAHHAIVRVPD